MNNYNQMNNQSQMNNGYQNQAGGQKEDYLDKALDWAEKKWGGSKGQNTQQNRATNEKITDGARNMFEKATGKKMPSKFSN